MNLRRLPAALALGVPATLIGHGLLFGAGHEMGGSFHNAAVSLTFAAIACFVTFFAALAWRCGRAANGSVLAARLQECLPRTRSIFASAAFCFAVCESLEAAHAVKSIAVTIAVLLVASWLIRELARAVVRAIADVTIAIVQIELAPREAQWCVRAAEESLRRRASTTRRHLARPPPTASALLRA